jgi:hypothetical protein
VIEHPPWSCNHKFRALGQRIQLWPKWGTTNQAGRAQSTARRAQLHGVVARCPLDLQGEFSSWRQNQGAWPALASVASHPMEQRQ